MAKSKEELKGIFVEGYKPTEQDFSDLIDGVQGPKGEKGDPGAAGKEGAKGTQGSPGKDGFGTEVQYQELVSRIEALEAKE